MTLEQDQTTGALKPLGTLRIEDIRRFHEVLCRMVLTRSDVTLDLAAVDGCDVTALQVLLSAHRTALNSGKTLRIISLSAAVADTAVALGIDLDELNPTATTNTASPAPNEVAL